VSGAVNRTFSARSVARGLVVAARCDFTGATGLEPALYPKILLRTKPASCWRMLTDAASELDLFIIGKRLAAEGGEIPASRTMKSSVRYRAVGHRGSPVVALLQRSAILGETP
jgi:hypothetical protein